MALSNMFREPRREITESILGIAVFALPLYWDYRMAVSLAASGKNAPPWPIGMIFIALMLIAAVVILWGLALFTHFLGEVVCNSLARIGLEVRPKERYR